MQKVHNCINTRYIFSIYCIFSTRTDMFKLVQCLVVLSAITQVILGQNDIKPLSDETLTVSVKILENEREANGEIRKTEVLVNLKVTFEEDMVKVNGKLTEVNVMTIYELDAEIVYSPAKTVTVPVIVHVLVMRQEMENGHRFLLEENIKLIDGKDVEQIDVKLLTIHINKDGKEYARTVEVVAFEKSHLKQHKPRKFCMNGDKAPRDFEREPKLPNESGVRNHKKDKKKSLCSRFHKLPFAARVAIFVGMVFVLFASVLFCTLCCCRKPSNAYDLHKDEKTDIEMEEEAEPLPEKLAFDDKQVLIA